MADAVIVPSAPQRWTIYESPGGKLIGVIVMQPDNTFIVQSVSADLLRSVFGPYASKSRARSQRQSAAIAVSGSETARNQVRGQHKPPEDICGFVRSATDQAKRIVSLRRYAITPRPRKPMIIMAQVDGSGTDT